ncbi:hypothetical protein ACG7TL_005955 [Trametes sanguinea]
MDPANLAEDEWVLTNFESAQSAQGPAEEQACAYHFRLPKLLQRYVQATGNQLPWEDEHGCNCRHSISNTQETDEASCSWKLTNGSQEHAGPILNPTESASVHEAFQQFASISADTATFISPSRASLKDCEAAYHAVRGALDVLRRQLKRAGCEDLNSDDAGMEDMVDCRMAEKAESLADRDESETHLMF